MASGRVQEALPPLYRRVRGQSAERVERWLARSEGDGGELDAAAWVARLRAAVEAFSAKADALDARLAELTAAFGAAGDEAARQEVLRAHLAQTVADPSLRRKDERALKRFLDFDALRERLERQRRLVLVDVETCARALKGALRQADDQARPRLGAELPAVCRTVLSGALRTPRLMNKVALLEALAQAGRLSPEALSDRAEDLLALGALCEEPAHGPWVRACALDALFVLCPDAAVRILRERLRAARGEGEFLFRRQALESAARALQGDRLNALLEEAAADPSEWVRMGAAELAGPQPGGVRVLRRLAGRLEDHPETSPKVRAAAAAALGALVRAGLPGARAAAALLHEVLVEETDPLVLRLTSEQLGQSAERIDASLLGALEAAARAVTLREEAPGAVVEAAAQAAQALARAKDPARRAWFAHLRKVARGLARGKQAKIPVSPPPAGLPPLPEDERWLGAVLADLSSEDLGLYAEREPGQIRLWRGDCFTRRAWRVAHEATRPAPNKRQGFPHTVGRQYAGTLRAHPARMDEITQTTVPGERVHIAEEGCWGRHLPTVDDLLDLPLSGKKVQLFSSHGVTTLTPPPSLSRRVKNRLRISGAYDRLAGLRLSSLRGREARERRRFAQEVERSLGVEVSFSAYDDHPAPPRIRSLFDAPRAAPPKDPLAVFAAVEAAWLTQAMDVLVDRSDYFVGTRGNGVMALAMFTATLFTLFLGDAWRKRESVRRARTQLPLCIGGWGTRGKSGTERLKAALFAGMGFDVFAKTTGSEAMFVHTTPAGASTEFFIFRPWDKATIWEQRDMAELASRMGVEVFLWECMALQPAFVDLLQNEWMRDDFATLTNAYPDHEDIQGPAGADVAEVITRFMPEGATVITTEDHFLPMFKDAAARKGTRLVHSPWWEAELISEELLSLFPYREHPRNMALVATLAAELGVSRTVALGLMAEHVQPEIGVLKAFGPAQVRGRKCTFINGHSANERTGFLNNWNRSGLDKVSPDDAPHRAVVTVVNNRWDRVARSEVFARILVEDAAADRHVLIGTNLEGLQKYVRSALERQLKGQELVCADDLSGPEGLARARARLAERMAFLKIPRPGREAFFERLGLWARAAGVEFMPSETLARAVDLALCAASTEVRVEKIREELESSLGAALDQALPAGAAPDDAGLPESVEPASSAEVREHALWLLARMVVYARLQAALPRPGEGDPALGCRRFNQLYRGAYRDLFLEQLIVIADPNAKGDQIIDACARAVPPGVEVTFLGAQNIKGTGLDWVYRWLALDRAQRALGALDKGAGEGRQRAVEALESSGDHGLLDTALCAARLPALAERAASHTEAGRLRALGSRMRALHEVKLAQLAQAGNSGTRRERWVAALERIFDYLDSVRRRRLADVLVEDLVHGRISHARAALETRRLYERQKGGWLFAGSRKKQAALAEVAQPALPVEPRLAPPEPVAPLPLQDAADERPGDDAGR
jgi:poly-gamma-glutamate synthase PgsB/CapB